MINAQLQLTHAKTALQGTLLQLDYLQDLINQTAMRNSQRAKITQQVHNIRVNSQGAMKQLSSVYEVPLLGTTK
ncbi:hypothetical protein [Lactiplantibacillus plantarum]|uniref:hypothetical protein n=1 Tax=Lactiplantibacillus plantarum TaxID=1590 RepID=UPI0009775025|nr:hypothetical protein [Lactiplantibacillus plantarum]